MRFYIEISQEIYNHEIDDNDRSEYNVHKASKEESVSQPITQLPPMRLFQYKLSHLTKLIEY